MNHDELMRSDVDICDGSGGVDAAINNQNIIQPNRGSITLILGPMFASKSTAVIAVIRKNMIAKRRCAVIKSKIDNRYTDHSAIVSHDGATVGTTVGADGCTNQQLPLSFSAENCEECDEAIIANNIQVVGIDEGQFFPDIAQFADKWANAGIEIIVSALNGDWQRKPFPNISELIPLCEEIEKLKSICMRCYRHDATFSHRISHTGGAIAVGGSDDYMPLCRDCFAILN